MGSFLAPETDVVFGDRVGGLPCMLSLVAMLSGCVHSSRLTSFMQCFFSVQRQMALARSFNKPEIQLHLANSAN